MQFLKRFTKQEPAVEYFFALNLSEETVRAAVWTVIGGQTRLVNLGKSVQWDGGNKEALLKAADESLSTASEGIRPEPSSVIFGLPETWTEPETINSEKKTLIKYLCDELELKPLGFVATDTAIIAYLKVEEGTPLSAVLIQLNSGEINLSLVKLGKLSGSELVGRSGDLGADTEEGLSRFKGVDALPARIILYNGAGDLEEEKQQLLSYDWEEKLPFIHFPKVESLTSEITIRAVALAGGGEAAKAVGMEIKTSRPEAEAVTAEALGFAAGEDVAEKKVKPAVTEVMAGAVKEAVKEEKPKIKLNLRALLEKLKVLFARLPRSRLPIIIGGGLTTLLIGLFLFYWYVPRASVVLYLEPQLVEQTLELTLDPEAAAAGDNVLPVTLAEKSVSGSKSAPVSGSLTIGDPAKGGATIYNKTASIKTFAQGTLLLNPDNLVFSLDSEVTVASRSSSIDANENTIISPGKAEADITAANIGPASNLAADTRLTFKQFSEDDYYAKTSGLSGGIAREVKAVDKDDVNSLEETLIADLTEQAKKELKESLGPDQVVIEREENLRLADKNFSAAAGEAADELSLTGQLNYKGVVYRQAELDQLLKEAIKTKVPENFVISEFSGVELGGVSGLTLPVSYQAKLLPRLDFNGIKQNLRGRYPDRVEDYLASLPQFVSADIVIKPNLPKTLTTLPRVTKNINLEIRPAP